MFDSNSHDHDKSDEILDSLKLPPRLNFTSWNEFNSWLDKFVLKEGFCNKARTSEREEGVMSPVQRELYSKYNNVIVIDTIIDNNYKIRIIACANIEDETVDTYQWILSIIHNATGI
ncbi:hypothetical protein RCL_jg24689.t1 [Rhizophagus clarus]|uniref:MULE transposase domain-containing protein n=1 Tax=Rhizophagus clarus TaxID=94130 RepID=A0A8H3M0B2_9GLOM|nr:hypothetical protein RCL_jg24689.t1 [Rhizophagus clarus]